MPITLGMKAVLVDQENKCTNSFANQTLSPLWEGVAVYNCGIT